MPKKLFKKYSPSPEKIKSIKALGFLGEALHEPNLWQINRRSVSRAVLLGMFWCFIPFPSQMVASAFCAIWFRCNIPISVATVWISNPITMPPIFYFNYVVGAYILNQKPQPFDFQLSFSWLADKLVEIGAPLYLGSFVVAVVAAVASYITVLALWRIHVNRAWKARAFKRRANDE